MLAMRRGRTGIAWVTLLAASLIPSGALAGDSTARRSANSPGGEPPKLIGHWRSAVFLLPQFLAVSADGTALATGGANGGLYVWDVAKGKPKRVLEEAPSPEMPADGELKLPDIAAMLPHDYALSFSGSGNQLAVLDSKLSLPPGLKLGPGPQPEVAMVSSSQLPELHLRVWDVASKKPAWPIKLPVWKEVFPTHTSCLTLSPDGKLLAAIFLGRKYMVALWDATDGRMETTIPVQAFSLAFRPDGKALAIGLMDGSLVMYDLPGKQKHVIHGKKKAECSCWMGFTPDGKALVTLADVMAAGNKRGPPNCGKVRVNYWPADAHPAKHPSITLDQYEANGNMPGRAIASDTATVALQTGPRTVNIFDAATGKMRTSVKSPHNIGFICLSRSGGFLAIVSFGSGMDGKNEFSVWDVTRPGPILAPSPGEPEEHTPGWFIMPRPNMPGGGVY